MTTQASMPNNAHCIHGFVAMPPSPPVRTALQSPGLDRESAIAYIHISDDSLLKESIIESMLREEAVDQTLQTKECCFLGFVVGRSSTLKELWERWRLLEEWRELAIRPASIEDCHPEDRFLWSSTENLKALQSQSDRLRRLFNDHLSTLSVESTVWETSLVARPSQIPNAGLGLYYNPPPRSRNKSEIPKDSLLCYYTGQLHTHSSSQKLKDRSYLLWIRGNTLVDPRPMPHIKARYINDPKNESLINCVFARSPKEVSRNHPDTMRIAVVATRTILPGEELFVAYGDVYWNQQPIAGNRLVLHERSHSNESDDDDDDDDLEDFPFSPLFFANLSKTR